MILQRNDQACTEPVSAYGGYGCPEVDEGDEPQTWMTSQACNEQMCPSEYNEIMSHSYDPVA